MQCFQHSFTENPQKIARYFAKMAVRALYDELALYPKPGLVSFIDAGAHDDMDGLLLYRSLFALRHYFFQVSLHSALGASPQCLVQLGLVAEKRMQQITAGINTHRGAIFALGIFCSSIARLSCRQASFSLGDFQQTIRQQWSEFLTHQHLPEKTSHGAWVKENYAVADAKQIAIAAYPLVFNTYEELSTLQDDKVFFGLLAYQRLLLALDDINVLYRTGPQGLAFARSHIQTAIADSERERSIHQACVLHALFSKKNISPGGVADMLGLLYFLYHVFSGRDA